MNRAVRAYFGAVVGALIVLLVHPRSRPFLLSRTLWPSTARAIIENRRLPENIEGLPGPRGIEEASLWLQVGAENEMAGQKITTDSALTLAEIAKNGEEAEPDNAFWPQMRSLFVGKAMSDPVKGKSLTYEAWIRASHLTTWNDHQTDRLNQLTQELAKESGGSFAWQQAVAYSRRSSAVCQRLLRHSRQLAGEQPDNMELRIANVDNGVLIRDGAKSIAGGSAGASMIDMAGFRHPNPSDASGPARTRAVARGELLKDIPKSDPSETKRLVAAVSSNEAWYAFLPLHDYTQRSIDLTRASILVAVLPTALMVCGLVGAAIYLVGRLIAIVRPLERAFDGPWTLGLGLAIGVGVFAVSHLFFPALWGFLVASAFGFSTDRTKLARPDRLGIVFESTLAALAAMVAIALSLHFIETSASEQLLARAAALPLPDDATSLVPIQLVILGLSVVVATAPAWGFLYRFKPVLVLPVSFRTFGAYLAAAGLSLSVISTPVCLVTDRNLAKDLSQLVGNEPNHYFTRSSGP